jgi:2-dehydropantoate 2-reductase
MSWHVLGAGSLGMLWAGRLAANGLPTTLILRDAAQLSAYQQVGKIRFSQQQRLQHIALPAQTVAATQPIQRLILACKAYDAEAAITGVSARLVEGATVLLLQNGLGSQAAVAARIPQARCVLVSSTEGAFRDGNFSVNFAGEGQNWLGDPHNPAPPDWLAELQQAGIPHEWTASIDARLWRKLAINCAINPLCVLYNCRNGGLMEHLGEIGNLCDELASLLEQCTVSDAATGLFAQVQQVIQATANNKCSMLQDVQRQQRTEISYLLGYACTQARQRGLHVPLLSALQQRLQDHLQALGLPAD